MPHRQFIDEHGRVWYVWDVHPTAVERRVNTDRRRATRSTPDRRQRKEARLAVPGELRAGWLAFQTDGERRRVTPIPEGWERFTEGELARMVLAATRLRQSPRLIE